MKVRLWGTRGSLASPGPDTIRYGGNTSCVQVTGPEIAQRLFVSLNTLRTHTRHIFTKLDVNTRRAAVRRAVERELL